MPRVKTNTIPIPFHGIAAEEFDSGTLQFSHLDRTFKTGEDLQLRKRPGRTRGHQFVMPGDSVIPEPEREIVMTVKLFRDSELIATGSDTVVPPGQVPEDEDVCNPACLE